MKKILSVLAAVGLTATASTAVVACGTSSTVPIDQSNLARGKESLKNWVEILQETIDKVEPELKDYLQEEIDELNDDIALAETYLSGNPSIQKVNELNQKMYRDYASLASRTNQYYSAKGQETTELLKKVQSELIALQEKYDRTETEVNQLRDEKEQLTSDLNTAKGLQEQTEAARKTAQEAFDKADAENKQLKTDLETANQAKDWAEQNARWIQGQLEDVKTKNSELTSQLGTAQEALRQTEQTLKDIQEALDKSNGENVELEEQLKDALTAKDQAEAQVNELTGELNDAKGEITDLTTQLTAARELQEQTEAARKTAQAAFDQAKIEIHQLKTDLEAANKVKDAAIRDYERAQADIKDLNNLIESKNGEIIELKVQVQTVQTKIFTTTNLISELNSLLGDLSGKITKALNASWVYIPGVSKPDIYHVLKDEVRPTMDAVLKKVELIQNVLKS